MSPEPPVPPEGGLGALLREARERAGLDLAAVADRTNVRKAYLEALETEDMGALPEAVYARNFLRLYARTVGVDPDDALARFDALRARRSGHATGTVRTDAGTHPAAGAERGGAEPTPRRTARRWARRALGFLVAEAERRRLYWMYDGRRNGTDAASKCGEFAEWHRRPGTY